MNSPDTIALDDDVRIISRKLSKGFMSPDELAKSLKGLQDVEELGEYFDPEAEEEETEEAEASTEADEA
ncbi:MAG: hypothetical protein CL940_04150 [Deltaproteobacteria bacterium]|nr:hypothetical protein [Deltaproteobacteria bacterium]